MDFVLGATLEKMGYVPPKEDGKPPRVQLVLTVEAQRALGDLGLFVGQSVTATISPWQKSLFEGETKADG